jgi:hypothetical protein
MLPVTSPSTIDATLGGIGQSATGMVAGTWVIGFFRDGPSAQDPIIIGTVASKVVDLPDKTKGFSDPSGTYPGKAGSEIPAEVTAGTAAAKAPFKQTLSLNYIAPTYPNNQVMKTRSGHVIEYDDTPGKERLSLMHKTGAFFEITNAGDINICGNFINLMGVRVNINDIKTP